MDVLNDYDENVGFKPKGKMTAITETDSLKKYREIDKIFESVHDIAETYILSEYPDAPDPDKYIEQIELKIKEYHKIEEQEE